LLEDVEGTRLWDEAKGAFRGESYGFPLERVSRDQEIVEHRTG